MPRKIMLVFFLFISEFCYAQVLVSEFNLSDINRGGMTKAQAEKLLIIALKYQKYDLSLDGVFVDGDLQDKHGNPPHPGYYDFSLGYDTPTAGAIDYWGLFSVSSQTGDIWEINKCERVIFPQLQKIQQEIMKKTGATFASEVVQRRGLGCTDE
ncbi:TPA: hypothetical protein LC393_003522 [Salmonella enterica subsp. enterica serovar Wangata]|nr:hypothetical protein [Salmonella enterica subsp. enterica serovar Wangata]EBV5378447.1 hypothetical protein [Salmonella enterica subsp. enterica serovar Wangata]ECB6788913.1 hypothetical protein [Salmonella enterica subsp. enterica serovar Wangata]EDH9973967.1 hypothetical protein [Salmonella enterica subsp. enterica serovar Wangata]EFT9517136.1 hypothetical protein [Salmonella enterica subsp. enterica serovar Wangata]